MKINSIEIVSFKMAKNGKSVSGTCRVDATYDDGVHISEDIGENFQVHAFISEDGMIMSRADGMICGDEIDVAWSAVSVLSKSLLSKNIKKRKTL